MNNAKENKVMFGKVLGELYRLQRSQSEVTCAASDSTIYGLCNGFESVIDEELKRIGYISTKQVASVIDILNPIFNDKVKESQFKGYYDIEDALMAHEIDRPTAIQIITYLKANRQFSSLIEKMDSNNSPTECRTFDVDE